MVKAFTHKQVGGRREGEVPRYEFSWQKTIVTILTTVLGAVILYWGQFVTRGAMAGCEALKKVDLQTAVLHQRISDGDEKLDVKIDSKFDKMIDIAFDLTLKEKTDGK